MSRVSAAMNSSKMMSKGSLRMATCQHPTSSLLGKFSGSSFSTHNRRSDKEKSVRGDISGAALIAFMGLGAATLGTVMMNQPAVADDKKEDSQSDDSAYEKFENPLKKMARTQFTIPQMIEEREK